MMLSGYENLLNRKNILKVPLPWFESYQWLISLSTKKNNIGYFLLSTNFTLKRSKVIFEHIVIVTLSLLVLFLLPPALI